MHKEGKRPFNTDRVQSMLMYTYIGAWINSRLEKTPLLTHANIGKTTVPEVERDKVSCLDVLFTVPLNNISTLLNTSAKIKFIFLFYS